MADLGKAVVDDLARELYRIHNEFEGNCMACIIGPDAHETFPCPTIRAFEAWRKRLR